MFKAVLQKPHSWVKFRVLLQKGLRKNDKFPIEK